MLPAHSGGTGRQWLHSNDPSPSTMRKNLRLVIIGAIQGLSLVTAAQNPQATTCDCLPPLVLQPGMTYLVNAWVKVPDAPAGTITYAAALPTDPQPVRVDVHLGGTTIPAIPVGYLIDGWQLIEGEFTMPFGTPPSFSLSLVSEDDDAYFDDVRLFPTEGSMKSYVYDPNTLRLSAELDERHFATFYEYDNEGRLVRIKKETERGRVTLQQTQYNTHHELGQ